MRLGESATVSVPPSLFSGNAVPIPRDGHVRAYGKLLLDSVPCADSVGITN